jgi:hypothetical protein
MANQALSRNGRGGPLPMAVGLTLVAGAGVAIAALARRRPAHGDPGEIRHAALVAYLHDHLGGAEVAIQVVERLRRTSTSADDRMFFEWLYRHFDQDREVVESLLRRLGASPGTAKRVAGHASGGLLKFLAGGEPGDLALFRTLEALAIGVQGKRCMWRALQFLRPGLIVPGRTWPDLESAALWQWEAIEEHRRALVPQTFAAAEGA